MTEPGWSVSARRRIAGRPFVVVGIGPNQMSGFEAAGGRIVGTVSVVPHGGPAADGAEVSSVLTVTGGTRDILHLVVQGYAEALGHPGNGVAAFLDRVDPQRSAVVASYLPLPHGVLGGRATCAADSGVAHGLERKSAAAALLARCVPTVPSEPLPTGEPGRWWDDVGARLGATRLVVQAAGLSGGGAGTFVCDSPDDVPRLGAGRVAPFVAGRPGNVMGVVDDEGVTAVLPPSRQLVSIDERGRPLYAGNVTGEPWTVEARDSITTDVRRIGVELAGHGFFGPFGADFIDTPDGRRLYHDLNPRMNGVTDSLGRLVDRGDSVPLTVALLSRPRWSTTEVAVLEAAVHEAASARPLARLWLTRAVGRAGRISRVPPAGTWTIDRARRRVTFEGGDEVGGDRAVLQPTLPAPVDLVPGDRLVLGNLFCDPLLVDDLGDDERAALTDAFLA